MRCFAVAGILLCLSALVPARASTDFFAGKTITYIVGSKAGGGYDEYARLIARHMQRQLPGATIVVQNLPGAGSIVAGNALFVAAADGLTIGTFNTGLIYAQLLARDGVRFDLRKLSWIGKAASDPRVFVLAAQTGWTSIESLRRADRPLFLGTAGVGSASHNDLALLLAVLGLEAKLVPGYEHQALQLAMLRGEVHGGLGSYSSLRAFVAAGSGVIVARVGGDNIAALAEVPEAGALIQRADRRAIVNVMRANATLGRMTAGPPGIPAARLAVLRAAYAATLQDPALRDEAARLGRPIDPAFGEDVADQVRAALDLPAETRRLIVEAIACGATPDAC